MAALSLDEFKKKVEGTKIPCRLCKLSFYALSDHLDEVHHVSVGQYRNRFPDAEVTSVLVKALIRQKVRTRIPQNEALDQIWGEMSAWDNQDLGKLGKTLPHNLPELVPETDANYVIQKRHAAVFGLALTEGMNLFISGPTECGKTSLVEQVHSRMNRPMFRCNMTGDTSVKNFVGQMLLENGQTVFKKGILIEAMEKGATLLVDEGDFMPPHIGAILHPALEKGRSIYVADLGKTIKAEKGFTVIMTANTGGKGDRQGVYTGTEVLNTAFLDRFGVRLEMDYMQEAQEIQVLAAKFPKVKDSFLQSLVKFAGEIREAFKQGSLEVTLGARKLEDFMRIYLRVGLDEALKMVIMDWCAPDEQQLVRDIQNRTLFGIK